MSKLVIVCLMALGLMAFNPLKPIMLTQDATEYKVIKKLDNIKLASAITGLFDDLSKVNTLEVVQAVESGKIYYSVTGSHAEQPVSFKIEMDKAKAMAEEAPVCSCKENGYTWKIESDIRACSLACE